MKIKISPRFVSLLVYGVYRLLFWTLRIRPEHLNRLYRDYWSHNKQVVVACWHDELLVFPAIQNVLNYKWATIVSASGDGEILALALQRMGVLTARGSSSRKGLRALMTAVKAMTQDGYNGIVTVDGPRGPRHQVKEGVLLMAQKAGAPIVAARAFPSRAFIFKNAWDKFQVPWPFASCRVVFSEPYYVTTEKLRGEVLAAEIKKLEDTLNAIE